MRRVLVTGANGFVGSHLVERLLREGHEVRGLTRSAGRGAPPLPGLEWVEGDICDEMVVKTAAAGVDTIFHLAAKVHETHEISQDEQAYEQVNVGGTLNVLKAAESAGVCRLVFISSVKAMGEGSHHEDDEETPPAPQTAYGRSKLRAEQAVRQAALSSGLQAVSLRLPMVYGPGTKGNLFKMMQAIDRGYFPPWPSVPNRRSMVHVANVVDAACVCAESPLGRYACYIVTDGTAYSTRELYEQFALALGKRPPAWATPPAILRLLARVGDAGEVLLRRRLPFDSAALDKLIGSACYRADRITQDLAFHPRMTLQMALPELLHWYRTASTC